MRNKLDLIWFDSLHKSLMFGQNGPIHINHKHAIKFHKNPGVHSDMIFFSTHTYTCSYHCFQISFVIEDFPEIFSDQM